MSERERMAMKIKIYRARLCTGGKTSDDIESMFVGDVPNKLIPEWIKVFNLINGMEVIVTNSLIGEDFALVSWNETDDMRIREFFYMAEQDDLFGTYDDYEEFIQDWEANNYEPNAILNLNASDVEILEELTSQVSHESV